MSKPTLNIFSGSESFGVVIKESMQLISKYFELNIPFSSSNGRFSSNLFGHTRIILIQASTDGSDFSGSDVDQRIANFIDTMEDWVNANLNDKKIYTDSFGSSYYVDPMEFTWIRTENSRIVYNLIMKEGT